MTTEETLDWLGWVRQFVEDRGCTYTDEERVPQAMEAIDAAIVATSEAQRLGNIIKTLESLSARWGTALRDLPGLINAADFIREYPHAILGNTELGRCRVEMEDQTPERLVEKARERLRGTE